MNIDWPLFLKWRERERERARMGSGKLPGCLRWWPTTHHTHTQHTQTDRASPAQPCQLPDSAACCWVSRFRHRPRTPGLHHLASVRLISTGAQWRIMQREGRTRNGTKGLVIQLCGHLVVWGFEWALWLGRAAQPGLMTPLVISPGLIQTRTGAGPVGW